MKNLKHIVYFAVIILQITTVFGVPAYPGQIRFIQPDGTKVNIYLKGDEFVKWAETEDGYTLLYNSDGYLEYAVRNTVGDLIPSGVKATDIKKRNNQTKSFLQSIPKNLLFSKSQISVIKQIKAMQKQEALNEKAFPTAGSRKLICILIGYSDVPFSKTQAEFNNLFNQVNYTSGGATGSVKDFYLENSYGQFNLTVDVAGPYTASQTMAYYGANNTYGNDTRPRELVAEAINLADPSVNFSQYDNDGDTWVDGIYIIYAGYGEEAGGGADCIWAHAWALSTPLIKDGVNLLRYSCSAELRGNFGSSITHIGVVCHEFGHVLGAPDYYDTNYSTGGQFSGTGNWDLMSSGSWNNNGATPAHHNGFTKVVYYNWAPVTVLSSPSTITLENAAQNSNSFYRINTSTTNEYFFLENREKHLFDANIPGSGMLIYHVHSTVLSAGNSNIINTTHPQKMYPVSQNATTDPTSTPSTYGSINTATCAWTGAVSTKTEFSDTSVPNSKSWAGDNTGKPISNISRNSVNKTVTFDFMGGVTGNPVSFDASATSFSQINLSWQLYNNNNVMIAWSADGVFGNPVSGNSYLAGNAIPGGGNVLYNGNGIFFNHSGLNSNTRYYYKAWSVFSGNTYSTGVVDDAKTQCNSYVTLPITEGFSTSAVPDCWSVADNIGNGQIWQFGTGGSLTGATGNYAYINSDAFGPGNSQNSDLITPALNLSGLTNITLSFKHYFRYFTGSQGTLSYSINNGSSWTIIQTWTGSTTNPVTFSQTFPALSNQSQVKFKWNYTATYGYYWSIDDVLITGTSNCAPPSSLTASNITVNAATLSWSSGGPETAWDIELGTAGFIPTGTPTASAVTKPYVYNGLNMNTNYSYYVRARCNGENSSWSGPYNFTTICSNFTQTESQTICNGQSYYWRGNYYINTGTYYDVIQNSYGCDSTYILNLTVHPTETYVTNAAICDGGTYSWMGDNYATAGTYYNYGQTQYGCNSTYVLNLNVNPLYYFIENISVNDNELPYIWQGNSCNSEGIFYASYQSDYGCDSIYQLNLTVVVSQPFWISKNNGNAVQANWDAIPGSSFYQLRYRELPSGSWITINQSTQNFRNIINLAPDTDYELQIKYRLGSVWQEWNSYYAPIIFKTKNLQFTTSYDIGSKLIVEWTAFEDVSSYVLQYKKLTDATWITKGYYSTNSAVMGSMEEGVTYQFRICPRYNEVSFQWTIPYTIITNFIAINVINQTMGEFEFSWDPVVNPAASDYFLQIRLQNSTTFTSYYSNSNTKTVSNIVPGQVYELRLVIRYSEVSWGVTGWRTFNSKKEMDMSLIEQNIVSVYPNPVNNVLNIQTIDGENDNIFWAIYDLTGKCVISGTENLHTGNNNVEVDVSQYANGMYILQSVINNKTNITTVIKE